MGILDRLGLSTKRMEALSSGIDLGYASPWTDGAPLTTIIPESIFPDGVIENLPLTREEALQIPAVARGRNLLVSTISRFPLVALKPNTDDRVDPQPTFLYRTDQSMSPQDRMAATVDDLIFFGKSLWLTDRGSVGQITNAEWIPTNQWTITNGQVLANDKPLQKDVDYILFHIPLYPGLLVWGNRTLRGARDTELAWVNRMQVPPMLTELDVVNQEVEFEQEELNEWEAAWAARHRAGKPSVGVTPYGMELKTHAGAIGDADLFVGNRNAVRTDIGNFLNLRPSMLDGTAGIDSLTYKTGETEKNSFYEFDLPFWTVPIEGVLSLDPSVPRGQRVRFDKYEQYAPIPNRTEIPVED